MGLQNIPFKVQKLERVKFGVQALQAMPDYSTLRKIVLECERLGFDSVWVYDHLQFTYGPTLECWTVLSALAEATRKIRIGPLVTCNAFRYPSLLAKMAATVDMISNGRLNLIGAGWHEAEALAYGISFPKAGARVEMVSEALSIIKKLWTEEKATFKGKYYSINDAVSLPKPVQKPYPPILIGGGGDKMLRVIARHANAWDCGFLSIEEVKKEIARLETACREVGKDRNKIENTFQSRIIIAETDEEALERTERWREERKGNPDDPDWKFAIKGSPETCVNILKAYIQAGVTHFTLLFADATSPKPFRLFANEVIPEFR
jgi:F420-dependent oxidoreductase-like protein